MYVEWGGELNALLCTTARGQAKLGALVLPLLKIHWSNHWKCWCQSILRIIPGPQFLEDALNVFSETDACFIVSKRDQRSVINRFQSFLLKVNCRWTILKNFHPHTDPPTLAVTHTIRASLSCLFRSSMPSLSLAGWMSRGDSSAEPWHWPMCQCADNGKHVNVNTADPFQWATVMNTS